MNHRDITAERQRPLLAFVGGFLGAGKTTLILKAAELLKERNFHPAIIFNDQDAGLVDTRRAHAEQFMANEVSGGCFCCRFSDLMQAAEELLQYDPDVILAEPVGSCIDLSATILHPLQALHGSRYRLGPLSVLVDPDMAGPVARQEVAEPIGYLFRQQLAEADLTCLTKVDLHPQTPSLDYPVDFQLSAKTGQGVEGWLNEILGSTRVVGARLLAVDYKQYGAAEAELGWLNLHADIQLKEPASPLLVCGPFLDRLEEALTSAAIEIAHLKVFGRCTKGWMTASICSNGQTPVPAGELMADASYRHELAINLRAIAQPNDLRQIVKGCLQEIPGAVAIRHLAAFRPSQPNPEHRMTLEDV